MVRFVLDSDVDEGGCRRALRGARCEVFTAREAGVDSDDRDVAAYGSAKGAVVVTRDREFTTTHRRYPVGSHIRLKCPAPAQEQVLALALPHILPILAKHDLVTIQVSAVQITVWFDGQDRPHKIDPTVPPPSGRRGRPPKPPRPARRG